MEVDRSPLDNGVRGRNGTLNRRDAMKVAGLAASAAFFTAPMVVKTALASTAGVKTSLEGYMVAGCSGDVMPLTAVHDGKPVGAVFDMLTLILGRLGLKLSVKETSFPAVIELVKTGQADYFGDNFSWTPARSKILRLTDPLFYAGAYAIMHQDQPYTDSIAVADLKGKVYGTGVGYAMVPDLKKVSGIKEVKLYDGNDPCIRDLVAGRLDMASLDAPVVAYLLQQNPDWKLKQVPIVPDPDFIALTSKSYSIAGISPDEPDLFDAMNEGIRWLWRTKQNAQLLAKYGLTDPGFTTPPAKNPRIGVDRDESGSVIGPFAHKPRDFSHLFA